MQTTLARLTLALGLAVLAGCSSPNGEGDPQKHEASALNASSADPGTLLLVVESVDGNFPLLATHHAGYRLQCATAPGMANLIRATGFDPAMLPLIKPIPLQSGELQNLLRTEFVRMDLIPVLACDLPASAGGLISIDIGGSKKFFLDLLESDDSGHGILHNVGCAELPQAMGLDLANAEALDLRTARRHFTMDDAYDISCMQGTSPSAPVTAK